MQKARRKLLDQRLAVSSSMSTHYSSILAKYQTRFTDGYALALNPPVKEPNHYSSNGELTILAKRE